MENNNEWKQPKDLKDYKLPKFPTEAIPPSLKRYIIELSEELQVPEDMVGTSILGILSICNQGKYFIEGKKNWQVPINLYTLTIANPSEKKSPVCKRLSSPIYEYEKSINNELKLEIITNKSDKEILEGKILTLKKKLKNAKNYDYMTENSLREAEKELADFQEINPIQLVADDITTEALASIMIKNDEKMSIVSAEGGIFSTINGRYNNNIPNLDLILKAFFNEPVKIDRKNGEPIILYNPSLAIVLFVQPITLEQIFSIPMFIERGLCARFIYSFPESKVGNRKIETEPVSKDIEEEYRKLINALLTNKTNHLLKLSSEAYKSFIQFNEELEKQLKYDLADIADWAGKAPSTVLRIAGNLHVIENYNTENNNISLNTILNAIKLVRYYLAHASYVYNIAGAKDEIIKAKRILRILKKNSIANSIGRHTLFRLCRGKRYTKS